MTPDAVRARGVEPGRDYRSLPRRVRLDETMASLDPGPPADPDAVHNVDQHRALRDD